MRMLPIFLLILWIDQIENVLSKNACPPPNRSCDCRDAAEGYVYCRGAASLPRHLPSNVTLLDLNYNNLGAALLKKQMAKLGSSSLSHLYMSATGLEAIESKAFSYQPLLRSLDLSSNQLTRLEGKVFYGLVQLETLFLAKSFIYQISSTVFTYVPSLRYLDLRGNKLSIVTDEFSTLTSLKTLILSNNQISTISDNSFSNLIHLNHLDISGNELTIPKARLFTHVASNNGTTTTKSQTASNHWACCGLNALEYQDFLHTLTKGVDTQLNIKCSSPSDWAGEMLSDISRVQLAQTVCRQPSPVRSSAILEKFTVATDTDKTLARGGGDTYNDDVAGASTTLDIFPFKVNTLKNVNSFSRLSDGQIALILVAIIVLVIVITAFIVRQCVIEKRKRAFGEFVDNLPNAIEVDEDDALTTTKTYRHDAPVYGSTGNVVDRHRRRADFATYSASNSKELPLTTKQNQRRKPPPYDPPSSPEGFAEAYEKPSQVNNNNSASTVATDDFYGYQKMLRRIASCPTEYDSDDGNVLWNIKNVK